MRTSVRQPPIGTNLNRSHPLSQGMVANWLLNEGGGLLAFDSSSQCKIPGSSNGVSKQSAKGNAVVFNGTSNRITLGTQSALNLTGAMSISAWIYCIGLTGAILSDANSGSTLQQYYFRINANKLEMRYGNALILAAATALLVNTWYHVGVSRKGTTGSWDVKIYINGKLDATATANATNPSAQQGAAIGQNGNQASVFFSGLINDVKVYNRCLTETDFRNLYVNPYQMYIGKAR